MSSQFQKKLKPVPGDDRILREFIVGSGISEDVLRANARFIPHVEIDPLTNEVVGTPLADLMGWDKYTRFGHQANRSKALGFFGADGVFWQAKIYGDCRYKGEKSGRYLAPKGIGDVPFVPTIPGRSWDGFLGDLRQSLITEGSKKALAAVSQGDYALSLFGCRCGVNKDGTVKEGLLPYVEGRKVIIAFDEDDKPKARKSVIKGIARLARAINQAGGVAYVASWDSSLGKGLDDLIAYSPEEYGKAIANAVPFDVWEFERRRKLRPHHLVCSRWFPEDLDVPDTAQLIFAKSAKGTGKSTWLIGQIIALRSRGKKVYVITHRISFAKMLCRLFGLDHIDYLGSKGQSGQFGYGLCIDSLHPEGKSRFNPNDMAGANIVLDECDQVLWHGLNSGTCQVKRTKILETLEMSIQTAIATGGKVYATSADIRPIDVKYLQDLAGDTNPRTFIIENTFVPAKGELTHYSRPQDVVGKGLEEIANGGVPLFHLSAQKERSKYSTINIESLILERFPDKKVLRIDSETIADKNHPAYQLGEGNGGDRPLDDLIEQYDAIVASPSIETAVSIETRHITAVFSIQNGVSTIDGACQATERVRSNVPRHVYYVERAKAYSYIGNGATYAAELLRSEDNKFRLNIGSLAAADFATDGKIHQEAWAKMAAEQNLGFRNYRDICLNKHRKEGYQVTMVTEPTAAGEAYDEQLKLVKDRNYLAYLEKVEQEPNPCDSLMLALSRKTKLTKEESITKRKGSLCRRYLTEDIDLDLIRDDDDGLYNKLLNYYLMFDGSEYLEKYNQSRLDALTSEATALRYDINKTSVKARVLALKTLLQPLFEICEAKGDRIKGEDLQEWFSNLLECRRDVKDFTGSWVSPKDSPITVAQRFLTMIGMKMPRVGRSGNVRFYGQPIFDYEKYRDILERWQEKDLIDATPLDNLPTVEGVALVEQIQAEAPELPEGISLGIVEQVKEAIEQLKAGAKDAIATMAGTMSPKKITLVADYLTASTGQDFTTPFVNLWVFA